MNTLNPTQVQRFRKLFPELDPSFRSQFQN